MADFDFALVQAALEQRVRDMLKQQPNRATVALNLATLSKGNGKNIGYSVSFGTDQSTEINDGADVSSFNTDNEKLATQAWSILHEPFSITGLAEAAAAGEPNALRNTPLLKLMQAATRLASKANQRYISGSGTGSPDQALGLTTTAGPLDSTGTFMGIDRSVENQWQGNKNSNGGVPRAVTLALLDAVLDASYDASGIEPEYGLCSTSIWRQIADLHRDKERINKVTIKGQEITLPGGQTAIEHNGIPIFKDKDWTAGTFAWLHSSHVGVEFLPPPPDIVDGDVLASIPIAGTPQEQAGTSMASRGLEAKLIRLAKTGDKKKTALYLYYNVWSDRCNALGFLTDLIP